MAMGLRGLHPEVRQRAEWAHAVARHFGVNARITSTFRPWDLQLRLRRKFEQCQAEGRFPSAPDCLFPANRPGDSAHNFGLAWDSVVDPRFQDWWDHVRGLAGFEVLPNDRIHAQVPGWRSFV